MKVQAIEMALRVGLYAINMLSLLGRYKRRSRSYGTHARQVLDWYEGEGRDERRPLVLFIYGGNWQSGVRHDYRFVADTLVSMGCDVVIPDYRLYPEARFGEILSDVGLCLHYVLAHTDEDRPIYVMGHSAGAQMGALLTLNRDVEGSARVSGFVGLAGPYDFYPFKEDAHWDLFGPEHAYADSQPVNFVGSHAPALYLLHGEDDRRVRCRHSRSLVEKQRAAGGQASVEVYQNMGHVDIILSFSALHRGRSKVIADIRQFVNPQESLNSIV